MIYSAEYNIRSFSLKPALRLPLLFEISPAGSDIEPIDLDLRACKRHKSILTAIAKETSHNFSTSIPYLFDHVEAYYESSKAFEACAILQLKDASRYE
jgi:hypothetical protein